jgi:hypothetical protein
MSKSEIQDIDTLLRWLRNNPDLFLYDTGERGRRYVLGKTASDTPIRVDGRSVRKLWCYLKSNGSNGYQLTER